MDFFRGFARLFRAGLFKLNEMAKTKKKTNKQPAKRGRPSLYSDEIAEKICELTSTSHKSLKTICEEVEVPVMTVLCWLRTNESFSKMYARAKDEQADFLVEEMLEIADDSRQDTLIDPETGKKYENKEWTNRSRLRVDARKWVAAKLKPRKYSEKLDLNHSGELAIKQITGMEIK